MKQSVRFTLASLLVLCGLLAPARAEKNIISVEYRDLPANFEQLPRTEPQKWNFNFRPYGAMAASVLWSDPIMQREVMAGEDAQGKEPTALYVCCNAEGLNLLVYAVESKMTSSLEKGEALPTSTLECFFAPGDADTQPALEKVAQGDPNRAIGKRRDDFRARLVEKPPADVADSAPLQRGKLIQLDQARLRIEQVALQRSQPDDDHIRPLCERQRVAQHRVGLDEFTRAASALAQDGWRADVIHPPAQRVGGLAGDLVVIDAVRFVADVAHRLHDLQAWNGVFRQGIDQFAQGAPAAQHEPLPRLQALAQVVRRGAPDAGPDRVGPVAEGWGNDHVEQVRKMVAQPLGERPSGHPRIVDADFDNAQTARQGQIARDHAARNADAAGDLGLRPVLQVVGARHLDQPRQVIIGVVHKCSFTNVRFEYDMIYGLHLSSDWVILP